MNDWGGKGNNLRQLLDAGYPVPQFGTLPADLMRQHLLVAELTGRPASDWPRRIIET